MPSEQQASPTGRRGLRNARLLDLRTYIAILFAIFGVIVLGCGLTVSPAQLEKAQGLNLSLWTGAAMLVLSAFFFAWLLRAPPEVPRSVEDLNAEDGAER